MPPLRAAAPGSRPHVKTPVSITARDDDQTASQEGDDLWLRIMHTKENQWRFINNVALHELNNRERADCHHLTSLSTRLQHLESAVADTDRLVRYCRAKRVREQIHSVAAAPVRSLAANISSLDYDAIARAVVDSSHATDVCTPPRQLVDEVARFRHAAERFREAATSAGVDPVIGSAEALERLADVTAEEASVIVDSAAEVRRAAELSELARSSRLADLVASKRDHDRSHAYQNAT